MGIIVKNTGATYREIVFSTLNIDKEFTNECVIIHGTRDLLL